MKTIEKCARQGDLTFVKRDSIPEGFKRAHTEKKFVVGHSETGHNHTAVAEKKFDVFQDPREPWRMFIVSKYDGTINIEHYRPNNYQHEPFSLKAPKGTVWEVRRQRAQTTPDGWEMIAD